MPSRQYSLARLERVGLLANETRHRILSYIAEAPEPVTVAGLTRRFGLNHNTIRQHLAKLHAAGLITEESETREQPGRPRLLYRVAQPGIVALGGPDAYERLAMLLTEVVTSGASSREVGRADGRRAARHLPARGDGVNALEVEVARQGFHPIRRDHADGAELVLRICAYAAAAGIDPATICQLHLGWVEGFAEHRGDVSVTGLIAKDPRRAGCTIKLEEGP